MGSESASSTGMGAVYFMYFITCMITAIMAISALALQKKVYDDYCNLAGNCLSFFIGVPAIATAFSIISFLLALLQLVLYHKETITGIVVFLINSFISILWLIVIAVGWAPMSATVDTSSLNANISVSIVGWFVYIRRLYNASSYAGIDIDSATGTNTTAFGFGLLVITCIIFALSIIMAIVGLLIHMRDRGMTTTDFVTPSTAKVRAGPWVRPAEKEKSVVPVSAEA